jgi:diguanylate cyclase (GGDEF)-like protein
MPWSSPHSAEGVPAGDVALRRFVEASRRAEIIALVNSARSEADLGDTVTLELCEAFEAEVAFVLGAHSDGSPPVLVGSTGLTDHQGERLLHEPVTVGGLGATEPVAIEGDNLLGIGAVSVAMSAAQTGGDRVLVGVARIHQQPFDASELALLEAVTKSTVIALQRMWLSEERERRATQQAALAGAAKALAESLLDPDQVLTTLCHEVARAMDCEAVIVYFGDEDGLTAVAVHGLPDSVIGLRRAPGEGLSGRVAATGAPQMSNDYQREGLAPESTAALRDVRSALSVPLRRRRPARGEEPIVPARDDGAISIGFHDGRWITDAHVELLTAFADLASAACRNADEHAAARSAASQDALTGCLNHASFQQRLRGEISRAERGAEPFTLVVVDLHDFRTVNERHGHLSGDAVLRGAGQVLSERLREYDHIARFGGDQFALILPETGEREAAGLVGRLVAQLRQVPRPDAEPLRAHFGLAEWAPGEGPTAIIERAEQLLQDAKTRPDTPGPPSTVAAPVAPLRVVDRGAAVTHRRRAEQRRKRLAVAARVGARLSRLLEIREIAEVATRELTETLEYPYAALLRLTGDGYVTSIAAAPPNIAEPKSWAWLLPRDHGAVGRCLRERRPVLIADAARDPAHAGRLETNMRSQLAVPVHAGPDLWGAVDLQSPDPQAFGEADARLVELIADHTGAALRTSELYGKLEQTHMGVAEALAAALEAKDGYTANHGAEIADLAVAVGRELELSEDVLRNLRYGAIFHDIGKIAVPDAILNKPGPLDPNELEVIKRHPVTGEQILTPVPFLADVRRIVRHDHERWDGTGYPDGLRGPQIPLGARIVLVVDAWHAMVSDRPYRRAMPQERARSELLSHAGSQFDPRVVDAFLAVLDRRG